MSRSRIGFLYGCVRAGTCMALALVAGPQSTAVGAREFRAADIQEENYPTVQALHYLDQLVTERTNGRHRIRVFHSRQLGEESQTVEQTRVGAIDLNRINVAAIGDVAPVLNVLASPSCSDPSTIYTRSSTDRSAMKSLARWNLTASSE
jgi:TRAP-type C4-dicarboxylate transport system substrate-binding protein